MRQVRERYLPAYGLVLATNLWQFRLVDEAGRVRERFDLADDEAGFWRLARGSRPGTMVMGAPPAVWKPVAHKEPAR